MHAVFVQGDHEWSKGLADGVYLFENERAAIGWQIKHLMSVGYVTAKHDGYTLQDPNDGDTAHFETGSEECGDALFYIQALLIHTGFTLEQAMHHNIVKLRKRYPEGYTDEAARARADKVGAAE